MRRGTLAVLLVVLLAAPTAATGASSTRTLSGRVAVANGTAATDGLVLAEPIGESHLRELSNGHDVSEALRKAAAADVDGLRTFETDDQGRYNGSLGSGAYRVVAVADGRVSRLVTVGPDEPTTRNFSVSEAHLPRVNATGATAERGANATVVFWVHNPDDVDIRNLTLRVQDREALPVQRIESESGVVDGHTVRFDRVAPDEAAVVEVTVRMTFLRRATLAVTATSDTHLVAETDSATVSGPDVGEQTKTALPVGGDGGGTTTGGAGRTVGTDRSAQGAGPGLGPAVALAAVLAAAALATRR